jgi:hypothetical protein
VYERFHSQWEGEYPRRRDFDWPTGRTFKGPQDDTVPFKPQSPLATCPLAKDLADLRIIIGPLDRAIARLRVLFAQKPRDEWEVKHAIDVVQNLRNDLIAQFNTMGERAETRFYARNGCSEREIARAVCKLRAIGHFMCEPRNPSIRTPVWLTVEIVRRPYCEMVNSMRGSRGAFASVDCSRL